jgi:hypothetical protein
MVHVNIRAHFGAQLHSQHRYFPSTPFLRSINSMSIRRFLTRVGVAGWLAALTVAVAPPLPAFGQQDKPRHTAEEIAKSKPSATFEVTAEQLRLIVGGATGKGTLLYQGKTYPFTMKGVTVGGIGATKVIAKGDVYFLERLEDFEGAYSAITIGAALGGGAGGSQYENNKGVFVSVKSKTEGLGLNLGLGAVQVAFAK